MVLVSVVLMFCCGSPWLDPDVSNKILAVSCSDNYVIPLAKKLDQCGVFGVSSDEYLMYAEANRQEWEKKGEAIVKGYVDKIEASEKMEGSPDLWASNPNIEDDIDDEAGC